MTERARSHNKKDDASSPGGESTDNSLVDDGDTRDDQREVDEESQESFPASDSPSW